MKIVMVHYRFYKVSGPETYLFNTIKLLEKKGHEVIPFSLDYQQNIQTTYSKYFPKPHIKEFHVHKALKSTSTNDKLKFIFNSFYNKNVYTNLKKLIIDENPDIVYVLQYNKLSTSVFDACHDVGKPVILRVSDYNLICAKNILYRDGKVCEDCLKNTINSVVHKCVHDSFTQSFIYYFIQKYNQIRRFQSRIDYIVSPSYFTLTKLKEVRRFKSNKFVHIPTFVDTAVKNNRVSFEYNPEKEIKLCYFGRIDKDKGIDILLEAIIQLIDSGYPITIDLFGNDTSDYCKKLVDGYNLKDYDAIRFKGFLSKSDLDVFLPNYHFSVVPSRWYDNMPNSLIESCVYGTPVIANKIGSLKELINDGQNGFLFDDLSIPSIIKLFYKLIKISSNDYNDLRSEN